MFRALPEAAQKAVMDRATAMEQNKYRPYLKTNITGRVADLMVDMQKAREAGDEAGAGKLEQEITETTRRAIEEGHITDKAAFQREVAKHLMFRYAPDLAAFKNLPKKLRPQFMAPQP
jgi:hypothetical protein